MERAGAGVARAVERIAPDGPGDRGVRQGQQRRRRPRRRAAAARGRPRGDGRVRRRRPRSYAGDARVNLERLPGEGPVRLDGSPWAQGGDGRRGGRARSRRPRGGRRRAARHGLRGGARGARSPRRSRRSTRRGAPIVAVDVPSGVDASTGVVGGRRRARHGDRHLPRGQAGAVDQSGQAPRGRASRRSTSASRAARRCRRRSG